MILWLLIIMLPNAAAYAQTPVNTVQAKKLSIIPVPFIAYTPETKWMGGVYTKIIYHLSDSLRPSSSSIRAYYSQNKQIVLGFDPEVYVGKYQLANETEFRKWPDFFYGIGAHVSDDSEETYTARVFSSNFNLRREWVPHLYAGLRYKFENTELLETEAGGMLSSNRLSAPSEGATSGAGITVSYDTRNHIFFPQRGILSGASATFYGPELGSDFTYDKYTLDFRQYLPLHGSHLFALQVCGNFTHGTPHFRNYAIIGGDDKLRGYNASRYRDQQSVYAQAEYRFPIWWRFRGALFSGVGDVANHVADFAPRKFKHTMGGGLRFVALAKEKMSVRVDLGFGAESSGFYLAVNEAF